MGMHMDFEQVAKWYSKWVHSEECALDIGHSTVAKS